MCPKERSHIFVATEIYSIFIGRNEMVLQINWMYWRTGDQHLHMFFARRTANTTDRWCTDPMVEFNGWQHKHRHNVWPRLLCSHHWQPIRLLSTVGFFFDTTPPMCIDKWPRILVVVVCGLHVGIVQFTSMHMLFCLLLLLLFHSSRLHWVTPGRSFYNFHFSLCLSLSLFLCIY